MHERNSPVQRSIKASFVSCYSIIFISPVSHKNKSLIVFFFSRKVMETKSMLYLVTEYASNGEMFSKFYCQIQ